MHAPERLGKYLIRRELGRGAMGVVYEGYDPMIERAVAIKVLRIDEGSGELAAELRMRFRREAQAAGRLGHPGIIAVYEYGEDAATGTTFIAMELVRGRDLKSLFDAGTRYTLEQTGRLMDELLAALQHAHARGVVHRDVKPGNIILLDSGGLKVADFGIAKLDTSELTQLGSVLGTVSHMSPEQLTGEVVDGRSDLYSCGVILYQLLTGERPFSGPPATVMHKVLHEAPLPPSRRSPAVPPALDAVVLKAMAKSADERHADAAAFAAELRAALAAPRPAAATSMASDGTTVVLPQSVAPFPRAAAASDAGKAGGATSARAAETDPVPRAASRDATAPLSQQSDPTIASSPSASSSDAAARGTRRGLQAAVIGVVGVAVAGAAGYRLLAPRSAGEPAVTASASAASATTRLAATPASAAASALHAAPSSVAADASAPTLASVAPLAPSASASIASAPAAPRPAAEAAVARAAVARAASSPPAVRTPVATVARPGSATAAASRPPPPVVAATRETPSNPKPPATTAPMPAPAPAPTPQAAKPPPPQPAPASAPPPATRVAVASPSPSSSLPATARTTPGAPPASAPGAVAPLPRADADCLEEARRGNARCQVVVGNLYRAGRGVPRDLGEAMRWYRMAAEQGSDAGQYELGLMYEYGNGVARDPVRAVAWFRKAAEHGHAAAQNMLGRAYENGFAGPANPVLAADWYRKAADQNLPIAEYNLGRLYLGGRGVFKDVAKGQALLQKAAGAGEPNAMVYVADMYARGDGKPRDPEQANRLYRQALARPGLHDRNRETAQRAVAAVR